MAAAVLAGCSSVVAIADPVFLFESSLKDLLNDKGFQLPNDLTKNAVLAASQMLGWLFKDRETALLLLSPVIGSLKGCIVGLKLEKKAGREKMWMKFHAARTSKDFLLSWEKLMKESLEKTASPIFFQHITDVIFKKMIKQYTPVSLEASQGEARATNLTYEEENALYYTAGYVIRETKRKLDKKTCGTVDNPAITGELNCCIVELSEDFEECNDSDKPSASDWTRKINRGGLCFVNNPTYQLFYSMEMAIRQELAFKTPSSITAGFKSDTIKKLRESEDVMFHWCMVSAEWDGKAAERLLEMIIELWLTVRGFAYTRHWMEGYKQQQKKSTQKSKGIRKQLIGQGK